jgi:hypothetical protein
MKVNGLNVKILRGWYKQEFFPFVVAVLPFEASLDGVYDLYCLLICPSYPSGAFSVCICPIDLP